MVRDKRKNAAYFESYIEYEKSRIAKKQEKLALTTDKGKAARICSNLFLYQMNLLVASFSYGESKETLTEFLNEACTTALKTDKLTYSDALTLASLAVMLDSYTTIRQVINKYQVIFESDKLLHGLSSYIQGGNAEWNGTYSFPSVYNSLDSFFSAESHDKKEDALLSFLTTWYESCKDCAWYDTLDNPNDVYYGYWCFEAAALAKCNNLSDKRLIQNEYFPVI